MFSTRDSGRCMTAAFRADRWHELGFECVHCEPQLSVGEGNSRTLLRNRVVNQWPMRTSAPTLSYARNLDVDRSEPQA